ncbi:MAG: hypothetical protein WC661_05485 [Opitutaceae bacterium]|jgi:hypothetical protein
MKRILLPALLLVACSVHAQTNESIIDRAALPQAPAAPNSTNGPAAAQGGDQDAGTQRVAQRRDFPVKFTVAYDAQVYYTTNVYLTASDPVEAMILANTASIVAQTPSMAVANGLLTPSLGFTYQRYNHGIGTDDSVRKSLDFDSYSMPFNLSFRFGTNWEANLGFTTSSIYRLNGTPDYHLIYRSNTPSLSLKKLVSLGANQVLSMTVGVDYCFTDAGTASTPTVSEHRNDKYDFFANAGYYYIHGKWTLGPYVSVTRSIYRDYEEFGPVSMGRRDTTCSVGASVNYSFNRWASARVFTSFDWRNSTSELYTYNAANAGVGATLSASF